MINDQEIKIMVHLFISISLSQAALFWSLIAIKCSVKITNSNDMNLHLDMLVYPFQSKLLERFPFHHHLETPKNPKHPHLRQQSRSRPKPKVLPKRRRRKAWRFFGRKQIFFFVVFRVESFVVFGCFYVPP